MNLLVFQSKWFTTHIGMAIVACGSFGLGTIFSIIHLISSRNEENKNEPSNLLDAEAWDYKSYRLIAFGYFLLTLSILTRTLWTKEIWSGYWSWDIRDTWALTIWIIYSIYLHLRFHRGWEGKKAAWFAIIGYICVIFTFIRTYIYI